MAHTPPDKRILVTGANGFIGRRLIPLLLERGYRVRGLVRQDRGALPAGCEPVEGDLLQRGDCDQVFTGIDVVYFLVHALGETTGSLAERERTLASHVAEAAEQAGVRRVIYLAGLGSSAQHLSEHLASRQEVGQILSGRNFLLTTLRAAIILGAGSASFEMIRFLVRTQPVLLAPGFLEAKVQPIAVEDVLGYLLGCLENEQTAGAQFDIGGPEVMTYREMLERFAAVTGDVNLFLPTPVFFPGAVARLVSLLTDVRQPVAQALLEGLDNDVICAEQSLQVLLPQALTPFETAVKRALEEAPRLKGR